MPVIIFLLVIAAIVWALALSRLNFRALLPVAELKNFSPLHVVGLGVVLTGSVLGYEFFHAAGGPIPITLDRMLLGGLLALAAWSWLMNWEDLRRINIMDIALLGVIGMLFVSTFTHDYKYSGNLPLSRLLFFYLLPLALYWVVRTAKLRPNDLMLITIGLGAFAVYLALTAVAEVKQIHGLVFPKYIIDSTTREFFGRGRGPFLNPVSNGIFQVVGFCCIWFWWPKASNRIRLVILIASVIVTIGIYATLTRSVWLTLILVGGLGVWITTTQSQKGMLLIAGTIAGIMLLPVIGEKVLAFKRDKDVSVEQMSESAQLRPLFLAVAMRMFQDRPVLGCGFGQYGYEKFPYLQDPYSGKPLSKTKTYYQHNVFLAYLTELGLFGLSLLLALLGVMARSSWLLWRNLKRDLAQRQLGLLLIAMLIGYSVNGMFHDTSIMPMVNTLLFFIAGIVNNIQSSPALATETTNLTTKAPMRPSQRHGFPAAG